MSVTFPTVKRWNEDGYRLKAETFAWKLSMLEIRKAEDIAEKCGLSVQSVRKVLKGRNQNPTLKTLVAICRVLNLSLDEVVEWQP